MSVTSQSTAKTVTDRPVGRLTSHHRQPLSYSKNPSQPITTTPYSKLGFTTPVKTCVANCNQCQTIIGVNFYKAARLEPDHFLGSKAFRPLSPPPLFQLRVLKTKDKNKITANNQTSFIEIDPYKQQRVRRRVLISQHCNGR